MLDLMRFSNGLEVGLLLGGPYLGLFSVGDFLSGEVLFKGLKFEFAIFLFSLYSDLEILLNRKSEKPD